MNVNELIEIEQIKQLKARYFRLLDQKRWNEWGEVFTDDITLQFGPNPEDVFKGKKATVEGLSEILKDSTTVHHGHMPEIKITGENTASGTWAMFDFVEMPGLTLKGYGHYEEKYVKEDGSWKIKNLLLTRLRVDITTESKGGD